MEGFVTTSITSHEYSSRNNKEDLTVCLQDIYVLHLLLVCAQYSNYRLIFKSRLEHNRYCVDILTFFFYRAMKYIFQHYSSNL